MPRARTAVRGTDLRGAARLAVEATAGLTDLVEALHARFARVPGSALALDDVVASGLALASRVSAATRASQSRPCAASGLHRPEVYVRLRRWLA